ncbi:hypothetical protein OHR68_29435 [Spirillospora sp. NBC_00431]
MAPGTSAYVPQPSATAYTRFPGQKVSGRLLRPAQLAQMKQTVKTGDSLFGRYGLGLGWRPAKGCDGGLRFHGGTSFGVISESGVSPDGRRTATAAVSTFRLGGDEQETQDRASLRLVDNAVCQG